MNGTFRDVRKYKSLYCFIDGIDGNSYFCHINDLVRKKDWKYVYNGNQCSFSVINTDGDKTDRAIMIVPNKVINPNVAIERENKRRGDINRAIHAENRIRDEKRKQSKDNWSEYCEERTGYVIMIRPKREDSKYSVIKPCVIYGDLNHAKSILNKYKQSDTQNIYLLRRCMLNQIGSMCSVKLLSAKNKVGGEIYRGKFEVDLTGKYDW